MNIKLYPPSFIKRMIRQKIRSVGSSPIDVERVEQIFYINYLKEGMIVFDVGANIGEITLLFSRFVGEHGKVHSFEASSKTFVSLKTVCGLSNRKNIILNEIAITDIEGMAKFNVYDSDNSGFNSLAKRPLEKYGINVKPVDIENVHTTTIDKYCETNGIRHIDLLKIDVEGAEFLVLKGARRMLEDQKISCGIFEFGQTTYDMGNNPDEIEKYLAQFGYKITNVVPGDPVFPGRNRVGGAQFSMMVAKR
jgi:FkbM family methyltransferase